MSEKPERNDVDSENVLGIHEFRVVVENGKASGWRRTCEVHSKRNGAHRSHGDQIKEVESGTMYRSSASGRSDYHPCDLLEPCAELKLVSIRPRRAILRSVPVLRPMLRIDMGAGGRDGGSLLKTTKW